MIFTLATTSDGHNDERKEELVRALGFVFEQRAGRWWKKPDFHPIVAIDTPEALARFIETWGQVVVRPAMPYLEPDNRLVIEIYDDYRE